MGLVSVLQEVVHDLKSTIVGIYIYIFPLFLGLAIMQDMMARHCCSGHHLTMMVVCCNCMGPTRLDQLSWSDGVLSRDQSVM